MEYVTLGKTGLNISRLGFGGIPIQKVDAETTRTLVKEMAEKYYPNLWNIGRLKSLVKAEKLSKEDFKEITGEEYVE